MSKEKFMVPIKVKESVRNGLSGGEFFSDDNESVCSTETTVYQIGRSDSLSSQESEYLCQENIKPQFQSYWNEEDDDEVFLKLNPYPERTVTLKRKELPYCSLRQKHLSTMKYETFTECDEAQKHYNNGMSNTKIGMNCNSYVHSKFQLVQNYSRHVNIRNITCNFSARGGQNKVSTSFTRRLAINPSFVKYRNLPRRQIL